MSRSPSPGARLVALEAARKSVGRKKVILNLGEMAQVVGRTSRRFHDVVKADPGFPVAKQGGEGVPFEFDAAKVLDHMIASARRDIAERGRRAARVGRLAGLVAPSAGTSPPDGGGQSGESGPAALLEDARALDKLIDVQSKLRAEKAKQGLLIERDEVSKFLWRWLSSLQAEVLTIEQKVERARRLDAVQRAALKDELAAILVRLRERLEQFIGTRDAAGPADAGDGTGGAGERRVPGSRRGRRRAGAGAAHTA